MAHAVDLTGKAFGRWTVVGRANGVFPISWRCRCSCGTERDVQGHALRSGKSTSCGCFRGEQIAARSRRHGNAPDGHASPEYQTWAGMLDRCSNPNDAEFARYGGRGIQVCERWRTFENFLADMGARPSARHSIDRVNNDGNYEPGNCRWATRIEQARNTSRNRRLTFNGETLTIAEWAARLGVKPSSIGYRVQQGWADERVLGVPFGGAETRSRKGAHRAA